MFYVFGRAKYIMTHILIDYVKLYMSNFNEFHVLHEINVCMNFFSSCRGMWEICVACYVRRISNFRKNPIWEIWVTCCIL